MPIPKVHSIESWNLRNSCCCPLPDCVKADLQVAFRDREVCRGGYQPNFADPEEEGSGGFDLTTSGVRIPRYKKLKQSEEHERVGTIAWEYEHYVESEHGRRREDWPATDWPLLDPFGVEHAVATVGSLGATLGTAVDGLVPVTLAWADSRPTYADGEDTHKLGQFELSIDGSGGFGVVDNEYEISLGQDDLSCHEFQVRHTTGGAWSDPFLFSLGPGDCCEIEPLACGTATQGNWQHTDDIDDGEGYEYISGDPVEDISYEVTASALKEQHTITDPGAPESGTEYHIFRTTLSEDQNITGVEEEMFDELIELTGEYAIPFGWSDWTTLEVPAYCHAHYPETCGGYPFNDFDSGHLRVWMREIRYRWYVPVEHTGSAYKVTWQIARVPDEWLKWRAEYYAWAVAKYAFLNRPTPGHPDYPVLSDFEDDPETGEDERVEALAAAIEALPQDPGDAPDMPEDLPEIIGTENWLWSVEQPPRTLEVVDPCDPTYLARVPQEPIEPDIEDFEELEDYEAAMEIYETALAAYEAEIEAMEAATRRQSDWFYFTPDRASDWLTKPTPVPDLPEDPPPTSDEIEAHEKAVDFYNYKLARYESRTNETFYICNVRHYCGRTPAGDIPTWDLEYLTTILPPLDPTAFDPSIYVEWYF